MNPISSGPPKSLIEAMSRQEFYPGRPHAVELRQTHISLVFLAGDRVYKIKKGVRFPFIDCSTLEQRRRFCIEEVRLNRRLSSIYDGVFPIFGVGGTFAIASEPREFDPRAVEYAVKMRRLPDELMLDRLIVAKSVSKESIRSLAETLAVFHRDASASKTWTYGSAAAIWRRIIDDLGQDRAFVGATLTAEQLSAIEEHCRSFIMSHWELLNDRARERRVRECHGDLRCEQICMTDPVEIFDCLEFSEHLRYCDVASEIAFLAMDLDRLGASELSGELVTSYSEAANDDKLGILVPFYKCFRASVRGKVESLRGLDRDLTDAERRCANETATGCFSLALKYAQLGTPAILVVCGLSGTGKSTLARMLQLRTGFEILNSDRIRKRLAGVAETARSREGYNAGIYSPDFTRRTYEELGAEAENRLAQGCGAIVDATFKSSSERRKFLDIAARRGSPVLFLECRADPNEVLLRLAKRSERNAGVSDATREVYLQQKTEFEPLTDLPNQCHVVINTAGHSNRITSKLEAALSALTSAKVTDHPTPAKASSVSRLPSSAAVPAARL